MPKQPSFYTLLGLRRSATPEEIRRSYLKSAKRLHPDTNIGPGETELFLDVQQAYQVLSDSSRRSAYDATLPPEEEIPSIVNQRLLVSRKELSPLKESQLVYLFVELSPKKELTDTVNSVPLNICLALDCSTSMKGEKLDTVKATAIQLIRKLKPQDIFSVVSFSDRAEVVIPATRQGSSIKMENRIQLLQTFGGTEIFQGLKTSLDEIRQFRNSKYINHIILLTDGRTYGDEQASYQLAKEATKESIGISGLGIGSSWNDVFLDQLASITGGQAMLVSKPDDIERLLTEKFSNLSKTLAENVTLEYQTDENVEISYAFRIQPETAPLVLENPLQLGPIIQGGPLSVLFEFSIHPRSVKTEAISLIQGTLDISVAALQASIYPIPIDITLPVEETAHPETPPQIIIQALSKLTLYRLQEKARREVTNGNYEKAAEHLQKLATHLLAQGERNLAKTVMLEISNIDKEKTFSEHGEKQIKYGTRALLLPGEHKL